MNKPAARWVMDGSTERRGRQSRTVQRRESGPGHTGGAQRRTERASPDFGYWETAPGVGVSWTQRVQARDQRASRKSRPSGRHHVIRKGMEAERRRPCEASREAGAPCTTARPSRVRHKPRGKRLSTSEQERDPTEASAFGCFRINVVRGLWFGLLPCGGNTLPIRHNTFQPKPGAPEFGIVRAR